MAKVKYYAVRVGLNPGIYNSWDACKEQVYGFNGAIYKSFSTIEEASKFVGGTSNYNQKQQSLELHANHTNEISGLVSYVDGSYNIETCAYGFGCVLLLDGKVIHRVCGKGSNEENALLRNVAGEILGSMVAIEYAIKNGYDKITLYYDYEGIEKWATGTWKTNKPGTQYYASKIMEYKKDVSISFVKVTAHSGDTYNDMADALAKKSVGII